MSYNLLVYYNPAAGYLAARREIERNLMALGDKKVVVEKVQDGSIIGVRTVLEPKEVIQELKERAFKNPSEFSATTKWIPVSDWCNVDLKIIEKKISSLLPEINVGERWSAEIETWQKSSVEEILTMLKNIIKERFVEEHSSKIVFIIFVGNEAAISIVRPDDIFTVVTI